MLRYLLVGDGDFKGFLLQFLLSLPIIFLMLSLNGAAQGYIANKLGDPTAKNLGKLTLNPLVHIDPLGLIAMVVVGCGWVSPVPINSRNFKKPRRDMLLVGISGPVANLLLAFIFAILLRLSIVFMPEVVFRNEMSMELSSILNTFLYLGVRMNITFAIFNLLPIPPLAGSRIFAMLIPPTYYFKIMRYERYISIAILVLLIFGVLDPILTFLTGKIEYLIYYIVFFIRI